MPYSAASIHPDTWIRVVSTIYLTLALLVCVDPTPQPNSSIGAVFVEVLHLNVARCREGCSVEARQAGLLEETTPRFPTPAFVKALSPPETPIRPRDADYLECYTLNAMPTHIHRPRPLSTLLPTDPAAHGVEGSYDVLVLPPIRIRIRSR